MKIILNVFTILIFMACSAPMQVVELNELDVKSFSSGLCEVQINQSVTGKPLSIAGRIFEK
jgi:hypothetical protein